ncbi:TonB-dependent receptor [Ferruginibacter albus]|uniref:TonB-dependent receptor n=1 Tax=Ferruginibacter albus TaxID=2875540 RepID=UPI001CC7DF27|nr:TonB-dependent receptor [Ferruginibacter albus]UAY52972.1 TonB-dependent receptor [Ferruginibacter albus]
MIKKFRYCVMIALLLIFSPSVFSQTQQATDSIPASDSIARKVDSTLLQNAQDNQVDNIPVITLDDDASDGSAQNISSQLTAGRDPFYNAASYQFSDVRFRIRGYDADLFNTYINGAPMENLDNGFTPYGLWSGLNNVFRNRQSTLGLKPTSYAFGDIGSNSFIDTRASHQRKQTEISYDVSNKSYTHRLMFSHSTGLNSKGWALTIAGSRRYAAEGYVEGTYYDSWSGYLGIDKKINDKHLLSLVGIFAPTENGLQGATVQEMYDLAGTTRYNPYWGYQQGKKRNARVSKVSQPLIILTHDWKISDKASLLTAASTSFGDRSVSSIDWFNAPDPRPDYYKYLPSNFNNDPAMIASFKNNENLRQINWDRMYNVNYENFDTVHNANGVAGNTVAGRNSKYVLYDRVTNTTRYNINTTLNAKLASFIDLAGGLTYEMQKSEYYKQLTDLLGGDYLTDFNSFAMTDYPGNPNYWQNNLLTPNRVVKVGDKYGYDYAINVNKGSGWAQTSFKLRKVDFYIGGQYSYTQFWRTGYYMNGIFPDNSYGESQKYTFNNFAVKGGITYKINGRSYLFANGEYSTKAPYFANSYISPETRDFIQNNLKSEKVSTVEAGYVMNAPNVKLRLSGYFTQFKDQVDVLKLYDDSSQAFGTLALNNIGKQQYGMELGGEIKVYKGLTVNFAAAMGRYYYNTRQTATTTNDYSATARRTDTVYSLNFHVPTPEEAYTVGLEYRSPKYWFVNLNVNYFRDMWVQFSPLRRTAEAVGAVPNGALVEPGSYQWNTIINQTVLPPACTVDLYAGYSWKINRKFRSLKKPTYLNFSLSADNILNNRFITGGYEQLRFDYSTDKNVNKFPPKYFYSYGTTYTASIGLRF